jgi:hypothetical protein
MRKTRIMIKFLVVSLFLVLSFSTSLVYSDTSSPSTPQISDLISPPVEEHALIAVPNINLPTSESIPTPIGPVETLPGSTLVYTTDPVDPSYIAKGGGMELTISGIARDKFTSLYWGPNDLGAIRHSLMGAPLDEDYIMVYDAATSDLPGGTAYWLGMSPNVYLGPELETRFRLLTLSPMVLASSVGISTTDVVLPVDNVAFSTNLLFSTLIGETSYVASNTYFDGFPNKSPGVQGYVISSFHDAFWYTAPDVGVEIQALTTTPCMNNLSQISLVATNEGPGVANDILVTGLLPTTWEYVGYTSSPCGLAECYNPTTGEWTVGELADGNQSTLTLTFRVTGTGMATLTETKSQYQVDPNATNDSAEASFTPTYCLFLPEIVR